MRRAAISSTLLLLLAHAACGEDITAQLAALGGGCLINSDCDDGLVCVFRRCHVPCEEDIDCPLDKAGDHERCMVGDKPTHVCQLDALKFCTVHSDCPGDQLCAVDEQCHDQCETDRDCLAGGVCVLGVCAGEGELGTFVAGQGSQPLGAACGYTSDCTSPLVCRDGLCSVACTVDADCPALIGALDDNLVPQTCVVEGEVGVCESGCSGLPLCSPGAELALSCTCADQSTGTQRCGDDCRSYLCVDGSGNDCS